jgi:hypothetical protein
LIDDILTPVRKVTEEELASYDNIDFDVEEYKRDLGRKYEKSQKTDSVYFIAFFKVDTFCKEFAIDDKIITINQSVWRSFDALFLPGRGKADQRR